MRYTRKDAEAAFVRLCALLNRRQATSWNDVGGWALDYNPAYGGVVVAEIITPSGGIRHPMGDMRRTPREFCEAVRFVEDALYAAQVSR